MDPNRIEAAKDGKVIYAGKACQHGHGTDRYVITGRCVTCDKANAARQYEAKKVRQTALRKLRGF